MKSEAAPQNKWMSVKEVSEELDVSEWTVRKMVERGELPATKIGEKPLIKISARRFAEWLQKNV